MLSDENVAELNRQLNQALKELATSHTPYFREKARIRIREIKTLMDELGVDSEEAVDPGEVVISLDEVVDTLRELFHRRKNRTK